MKTLTLENSPSETPKVKSETNSIVRLVVIGAASIALPLALYLISRLTGSLSSAKSWMEQGGTPGPWHNAWQGYTLYLPFVAALVTLAVGARHLSRQHPTRAIRCLGLSVVQGALGLALYIFIGWTIS